MRVLLSSMLFLEVVAAFHVALMVRREVGYVLTTPLSTRLRPLHLSDEPQQGDTENPENFFPDLEFIDYSDPNYIIDQGMGDEFFKADDDDTEAQIEAMREDRRRRNDEFQFETYFERILKSGDDYFGEWTVYKTSTFLDGVLDQETGSPRLVRAQHPMKVKSRAYKIKVETDSEFRVDGERICHEEILVVANDVNGASKDARDTEAEIMGNKYWPDELTAFDFRGWQGVMCVGAGHTISSAQALLDSSEDHVGPFSWLNAEVGITSDDLRMRLKLAYCVKEDEKELFLKNSNLIPPSLHLKSLTVCREARGKWPMNGLSASVSETDLLESEVLFGIPGAKGGLYDPPPVGGDAQAGQYMMLDLDGGATVLFPYLMQQDSQAFDGFGWVTSLDWTPGNMRFQVDRKVKGGSEIIGLRTLELSEVASSNADRYRPRDGGANMMQ